MSSYSLVTWPMGQSFNNYGYFYHHLQTSFNDHSTERVLLSVTEALKEARAADRSSVLILLDPSTACDIQPPYPTEQTGRHGHHRQTTFLVWILSHWVTIQCVMALANICATPPHHRGAPRLSWGPFSLPYIPYTIWVKSTTRMASPITAMQMIPNSICPFLLVTPQCQHKSLTDFLTYLHGWKKIIYN